MSDLSTTLNDMSASRSAVPKRNVSGGLLGLLGMSGLAGVLVAALITPMVAVLGVGTNTTITLFESLPDYLEIGNMQQKTELYATQNGQQVKFAEFYAQNREEVELDQISPYVADAALSTEDPRFYEHGGVDVISAVRAVLNAVLRDGSAGGSTITMQYVKNVRVQQAESILDPEERQRAYQEAVEQSISRKLQEMRLAIGVERQYGKEDILEGYLNIALFGGTVYGIESASKYYFGKPSKDLSLTEAASLVAMVQNPNYYRIDVVENIPNNEERRNYVLRRMHEEGKIDKATYEDAIQQPVVPNITPSQTGCAAAAGNAAYFCDYVRNVILRDPAFGETGEEREFNFQTKGYRIFTTLDLDLQAYAQATMSEAVPPAIEGMSIGAATSVVEPGTGRVLAMAQNTQFDESAETANTPGYSAINFNTDYQYGGSNGFPVGSTYKIFTLAEWVAAGHSIYDSVNGATRMFNMANFQDSCGEAYGGEWDVQNDSGTRIGSVDVKSATMNSYNTAYVAMGEQLDQCRIRDMAMAFGAHRADGKVNESLPSAILGQNEIAPMSMAVAIAGFANKGVVCSPVAIDSIELHDGTKVTPPRSNCAQVITEAVANEVNEALEATASNGTVQQSNPGIAPMIGKTGTSDNAYHTWVIGATTKAAVSTWIGNITGEESLYYFSLGHRQASQERHWITYQLMEYLMNTRGGDAFPRVEDKSKRELNTATIPDLTGRTIEESRAIVEQLGFQLAVGPTVSSEQKPGTVARQIPSPNTVVDKTTSITIYMSNGEGSDASMIPMPPVTGRTFDEAVKELADAGFTGTIVQRPMDGGGQPRDTVLSADPPEGSQVPTDANVTLYVAQ